MTATTTTALPVPLRRAIALWRFAVAAGIAESVIGIADVVRQGLFDGAVAANIGVRVVVYTLALVFIARLAQGHRWARTAITILLSVIGLASMLIPAMIMLLSGATFLEVFGGSGLLPVLFAIIHVAHIASVILATVLMYLPASSRHLSPHRGVGPRSSQDHAGAATLG